MAILDGVVAKDLTTHTDERGYFRELIRVTDDFFGEGFGQWSHSLVLEGVAKAWHIHKEMTLNNAVITGMAKLVLFDIRKASPTHGELMELFIGEQNYCLVQIPPGIANGYKAFGDKMVILANCASMPHDKNEIVYIDPFENDIPYDWSLDHG